MKKTTDDASLTSEIIPFASSRILSEKPEGMTLIEQVQAHVILKKIGEIVESRVKELREPLMTLAEAKGEVSESGTRKFGVAGSSLCVEYRNAKEPEGEGLKKLLASKDIDLMEVFEEVKALQLNASKLNYLVETGKITKEELAPLCKGTKAFRIYPSSALKEAVEELSVKGSTLEEQKALPKK